MKIPKIIHYCWYGGKPMPKMLRYCLATWRKHLPDYEFMLWNETNTTFDSGFIKKAHAEKNWAFVSDYVRLKVVYEHGGIYMDTDMMLLKPLDDFLENECFLVAEHQKSIGVGIFGAIKNNSFVKLCFDSYLKEDFSFFPIPKIVSNVFLNQYKVERKFVENIVLSDIVVYQPNYFYSLPYTKLFDIHHYKKYLTDEVYGVHLWQGSWHSYNELYLIRRKEYAKAFERMYHTVFKERNISFGYIKKVLRAFKDSFLTPNAFK